MLHKIRLTVVQRGCWNDCMVSGIADTLEVKTITNSNNNNNINQCQTISPFVGACVDFFAFAMFDAFSFQQLTYENRWVFEQALKPSVIYS